MNNFLNNLFSLEEKVAVVIGGGGHLCSAMSMGLASSGADLIVVDMRLEKAEKTIEIIKKNTKGRHLAVAIDATNTPTLHIS